MAPAECGRWRRADEYSGALCHNRPCVISSSVNLVFVKRRDNDSEKRLSLNKWLQLNVPLRASSAHK